MSLLDDFDGDQVVDIEEPVSIENEDAGFFFKIGLFLF